MSTTNAANLATTITRQAARREAITQRLAILAETETRECLEQAEALERDAAEKLWRAFAPTEQWGAVPDVEEIRAAADRRIPRGQDSQGHDRDGYFNACRASLEQATAQVAEWAEAWQAEAEEREALEAERAELESRGHDVPATRQGLEEMAEAIAAQRAELERVNRALEALDTNEATPGAATELAAAQLRVDEVAAAAALGEADEAEQRAAATALAKVRQRASNPQEARKHSEAARRGLERKAEELAAGIDHLQQARREVEADFYEAEWKKAEGRLVALLEGDTLAKTMQQLRESRNAYSRAYRSAYGSAPTIVGKDHLEISGPLLTHHGLRWPLRV